LATWNMKRTSEGERSELRRRARVDEDLRRLGVKELWTVARNRESWIKILRKPRLELRCSVEDDV
jgi:hypothetical protein